MWYLFPVIIHKIYIEKNGIYLETGWCPLKWSNRFVSILSFLLPKLRETWIVSEVACKIKLRSGKWEVIKIFLDRVITKWQYEGLPALLS